MQITNHHRHRSGPPRRTRVLTTVLGAALVSVIVAGCGSGSTSDASSTGGDTETTVAEDDQPVSGGSISVALNNIPLCSDPQVSPQYQTYEISRNVVDSLVAQTADGKEFVPWLAESWEVSPDAKQFTFKLRDDVTFSDGEPFNAEVVKANFDRIKDPATKSQFSAGLLAFYTGAEVVDPYTVRVNFSQGFVPFLQAASTTYLGIESPKSWATLTPCDPPIGSGPFVAKEYTPNVSLTLERSPVSYDWAPSTVRNTTGASYLDEIEYKFVTEESVRTGGLSSGQFDYIEGTPPKDAESQRSQGLTVIQADQPGISYGIGINTKNGAFTDQKVREALAHAIDAPGIAEALYLGEFKHANNTLSPTTPDYDETLADKEYEFDVALSNELLDSAGWKKGDDGIRTKDGEKLTFKLLSYDPRDQREQINLLVQEQAAAVGFDAQLIKGSTAEVTGLLQGNDFSASGIQYIRAEPDLLRTFFAGQGITASTTKTDDPQLNAWLTEAAAETDPAKRSELYAQAQQFIFEQVYTVPIYVLTRLDATTAELKGVLLDAAKYPYFIDAYLEK